MAVRRRRIYPDATIETDTYGPIDFVSDEAYLDAVLAAAQTQALAGGVLSIVVERHPTDLQNEMVTTGGIIEWKDRTDARPAPEPVAPRPAAAPAPEPETLRDEIEAEVAEALRADDVGDGLDPSTLEEEDLSSVPEAMR